ncbi:MAG: lipid-A-disaccharide synthase [Isosphaeraceae bacterium]|nr:lipid-A-disaccharide synthase [Isosphaeraceae bacterium]
MRIFISAGEPSGDHHGADLIEAIRERVPDAEFVGFGGERMTQAGARLLFPLVDLAVMWFLRVLWNLPKFFRILDQADDYFRDARPDVVVLIDYPGFHWHVARKAKERGIPVVYFIPPQIWAWGGWRVAKVRKTIDRVLCSLPFEPAWYHARGVADAEYVGHPFFDELAERRLDETFLEEQRSKPGRIVAILPGSRTQEITRNLPIMLRAAAKLRERVADARFVVTCLHERHRLLAEGVIAAEGVDLPIELLAGRTPEILRLATFAWSVSGSVSLELMMETLPTVILYKLNRLDLWIARPFIRAKYITLVNLLADAELMPEYLTPFDVSAELASHAERALIDRSALEASRTALRTLRDRVAVPGASARAADRILDLLASRTPASTYPAPHLATARRTADERN